jgi:hypothetical protein
VDVQLDLAGDNTREIARRLVLLDQPAVVTFKREDVTGVVCDLRDLCVELIRVIARDHDMSRQVIVDAALATVPNRTRPRLRLVR